MWIDRREWEKIKQLVKELSDKAVAQQHEIARLTEVIKAKNREIDWLRKHFPIAADCLIFAYTIDGVTFKSKHMSLSLPAGKQVTLTVVGLGKDAQGNNVEAPVTQVSVSQTGGGLTVSQNADGTYTLKYATDGTGTLNATAVNSLGSPVSGTDNYTTGGTTPPPVVATTLGFKYSDPVDITA